MKRKLLLRAGLSSKWKHSADAVNGGVRSGPGLNTLFRGPRPSVDRMVGAIEGVGTSAVILAKESEDERTSAKKRPSEPRYRSRMARNLRTWVNCWRDRKQVRL
jgi:hypothetical protein